MFSHNNILSCKKLSTATPGKKSRRVLTHSFSATLEKGKLTCLVGMNGAGKSTLIRTLAGLQPAAEGKVFIDEKEIQEFGHKQLAKIIALTLTDPLPEGLETIEDIIALGRFPYTGAFGLRKAEDQNIIRKAAENLNILGLLGCRIKEVSDGEKQKALIAKVLCQGASILLMDEPLNHLDWPTKIEILQLLKSIAEENDISILISIHDLELALQFAHQIWWINKNGDFAIGTLRELQESKKSETFFPKNILHFLEGYSYNKNIL